jgi:hypothetical protein
MKAPAPTPGGVPATTPLAAEVLASLNNQEPAATRQTIQQAASAPMDKADGDAAATLSGLCSGSLEPPPASHPAQRQREAQLAPALAALLQDTHLLPPSLPMHTAAMAAAAAAAAGPALLPPRRASASLALAAPPGQREQRPCNCKRSMCLKMYCECFAAGGAGGAACSLDACRIALPFLAVAYSTFTCPPALPRPTGRRRLLRALLLLLQLQQHTRGDGGGDCGAGGGAGQEPARL